MNRKEVSAAKSPGKVMVNGYEHEAHHEINNTSKIAYYMKNIVKNYYRSEL